MSQLILFNKPFGVLTRFRSDDGRAVLADYLKAPGFYPAGRLDRDSEGLLLLTDDGALQHRIAHPDRKMPKTYWAQIAGTPSQEALQQLRQGLMLDDGPTRPAKADLVPEPDWLWPRDPPVPLARHAPACWLRLTLTEGRNRQVRRMTAAIGHPTLRLIRQSIGPWSLDGLPPGEHRKLNIHLPQPTTLPVRGRR